LFYLSELSIITLLEIISFDRIESVESLFISIFFIIINNISFTIQVSLNDNEKIDRMPLL